MACKRILVLIVLSGRRLDMWYQSCISGVEEVYVRQMPENNRYPNYFRLLALRIVLEHAFRVPDLPGLVCWGSSIGRLPRRPASWTIAAWRDIHDLSAISVGIPVQQSSPAEHSRISLGVDRAD